MDFSIHLKKTNIEADMYKRWEFNKTLTVFLSINDLISVTTHTCEFIFLTNFCCPSERVFFSENYDEVKGEEFRTEKVFD